MHPRYRLESADETPFDLSALDPDRDPTAQERLVRDVLHGRQRRYPAQPESLVSVWATSPHLGIVLLAMAATLLLIVGMDRRDDTAPPRTVAESLGVPPEFLDGTSTMEQR